MSLLSLQDRISVIHFRLPVVIMYAEPCELGWDPAVAPHKDGLQYDSTVHSTDRTAQIYRTLCLISDSGARTIRVRGTRVWKTVFVQDGEESGEPVILKDVWPDSHRSREGDIYEDFRDLYWDNRSTVIGCLYKVCLGRLGSSRHWLTGMNKTEDGP